MKIYYSGNKNAFKCILLSIMSMVKHTGEQLEVGVLSMDLHEVKENYIMPDSKEIAILDRVVKEKNPQSSVRLIDMTALYKQYLISGKNERCAYTPYTLLRLLLGKVDKSDDKVIYIDTDTMLLGDIKQMYDINLEGYEFGAVLDYTGHKFISKTYCNAGVLLLNLGEIKRTKLFDKAMKYVLTHKMFMPDQTALHRNVERKLIIDGKFNEQRSLKPDTVIKHFCKGIKFFPIFHIFNIKQTEIDKVHNKLKIYAFDDIYEDYNKLIKEFNL